MNEIYDGSRVERATGEALVEHALDDIADVKERVARELGIPSDSPDVTAAADEALVFMAERSVDEFGSRSVDAERSVDAVAIESALEVGNDSKVATVPIFELEADGYGAEAMAARHRLDRTDALLPGGQRAAALLSRAIDTLARSPIMNRVPREVEAPSPSSGLLQASEALRVADDKRAQYVAENPNSAGGFDPYGEHAQQDMQKYFTDAEPSDAHMVAVALRQKAAYQARRGAEYVGVHGENQRDFCIARMREDFEKAICALPDETLGALFTDGSEDGEFVRSVARRIIGDGAKGGKPGERVLTEGTTKIVRAYGYKSITDFFRANPDNSRIEGDVQRDLYARPEYYYLELGDSIRDAPEGAERRGKAWSVVSEFLRHKGVDGELIHRMNYAMRGRISKEEHSTDIEPGYVLHELNNINAVIERIGTDGMDELAREAGIVNFGTIPVIQLETTLGLVRGDARTVKRFRERDCSVMIRDATEDHNGAFAYSAEKLGGLGNANAVFELSSLGDDSDELSRRVALLEKHDARPTTLIIAGHGEPGFISIGDGWFGYRPAPPSHPRAGNVVPVTEDPALRRLYGRLRPSSRHETAHIIMYSCSQASTETKTGVSTAIRIARTAGRESGGPVEVYAPEIPTNMDRVLREDGHGIKYTANGNYVDTTVYKVDETGRLSKRREESIPLDNAFIGYKKR